MRLCVLGIVDRCDRSCFALASLGVCLSLRSLVLRTLLYLPLFCSLLCHTRLDRVSSFMSLEVGMVYLKWCCSGDLRCGIEIGCSFWVIGKYFGRSCFALAIICNILFPVFSQSYFPAYFISLFVYWFGRLCFALCFIGRLFCSLLCHTRLDRVSGLCLRCLGWYLRNAIVVGTFGSGIERMLCVFRLSANVSDARASHFALLVVVLLTSKSCPAWTGIYVVMRGIQIPLSFSLLWYCIVGSYLGPFSQQLFSQQSYQRLS